MVTVYWKFCIMSVGESAPHHFEHFHSQILFIHKYTTILPDWEFDDPYICCQEYLTTMPRAWMGSESIAHEGERNIIVLVKSN